MSGQALHQDFAGSLIFIPSHAHPDQPDPEGIFFIGGIHCLRLDPLLLNRLIVHQDRQLAESRQMRLIRRYREPAKAHFVFCDPVAVERLTILAFNIIQHLEEVGNGIGTGVIFVTYMLFNFAPMVFPNKPTYEFTEVEFDTPSIVFAVSKPVIV